MSDQINTPFETRCNILADLWLSYRDEIDFKDFIQYNDVGLPAAFIVSEELATPNDRLKLMINETFDLLLAAMDLEEDTGFDSIDDMLVG
jgi:hypothetical protein